jgi:iron(III) transport system substrate-binding protein
MKRNVLIGLAATAAILLGTAGCSKQTKSAAAPAASAPAAAASAQTEAPPPPSNEIKETAWYKANLADGSQTPDQLYEAAKKEGKVVIYSISSRITDVKKSFEAKYPGVTMEASDISQNDLYTKITTEIKAGVHNADVIHFKDTDGQIYMEQVMTGQLDLYKPADICAHIPAEDMKYEMPFYVELNQWYYNTNLFPNGPDIHSWWDLTKPEWKHHIILQNPLSSNDYLVNFTALSIMSDQVAADYQKVFGHPIKLDSDCPNAGYQLVKDILAQDPIYQSSSDGVCNAVGDPKTTTKLIGWAASSKMRKNKSNGWVLKPLDISPGTSVNATNNLYVVDGCPHPNAAKLLIRWMLGEADGKGAGFKPFNTLGGWSIRNDVTPVPGNPPLGSLKRLSAPLTELYDQVPDMRDFITPMVNK